MSTPTRPLAKLHECRLCHDPIVFARLDTGKAMPLNPMPDSRGNVAVHLAGGRKGAVLLGFVISRDRLPGPLDQRMVPHYATCEKQRTPTKPARQPDEPLF